MEKKKSNKHNIDEMLSTLDIKGIISNDGSVASSCRSSSVAAGNTTESLSSIGDTANPGNEGSADTDHMPASANSVILPCPVSTVAHSGA